MNKIPGDVTGEVFGLSNLLHKLEREIDRLKDAQNNLNKDDAYDHAMNGAFTAFHLLEWEEKEKNPSSKVKARALLDNKNNTDLNLLHDVVTHAKHVTISDSPYKMPIEVRTSAATISRAALSDDGSTIWERGGRKLVVKFGEERAEKVLTSVLSLFQQP